MSEPRHHMKPQDIENKLDEDFLFYLGFTGSFTQKVQESDKAKVQQWLQKLCGEPSTTTAMKRNRNIFLSNLLLDIQDKQLTGPFLKNADEVDINDAPIYFPAVATDVHEPTWLQHAVEGTPVVDDEPHRADGRTYVATRTLPGGDGAFAYIAINMSDEPMWFGGGEGAFDKALQQKFDEYVPPQTEMELILARRKNVDERQRVITFYEVVLQNIADELDEKIKPEDNAHVNGLLEQMIADLQRRGVYGDYATIVDEKERRTELLLALFDVTNKRKRQTQQREEILDDIDAQLGQTFFDQSGVADDERYEMPAAMWEYCINRQPGKKNLDALGTAYPDFVVKKFLEFLADTRESIARIMQRRHVGIISEMRKELKDEAEKLRAKVNQIKVRSDQMMFVHKEVEKAYQNQQKALENRDKRKKGGETQLTKLYDEMRETLKETQFGVELEAEHGRALVEQINSVNGQTDVYNQITERTIMITEEANMELMKNIKRLSGAVNMHQNRLEQLQGVSEAATSKKGGSQMFIV